MHFYYSLCISRQAPPLSQFFRISCVVCRLSLSPIQELEPGAMPFRVGRCAARYPHGLPTAKQKYLDYDYAFPPKESNHRKGPCRARDWVLSKLGQFQMPVYKFVLQVSQEGRCTFSLFVLFERPNLFLARHTFVLIRECAVFNAFFNSLV